MSATGRPGGVSGGGEVLQGSVRGASARPENAVAAVAFVGCGVWCERNSRAPAGRALRSEESPSQSF
ncbi:hypothetical protein VULLAG_LOCUS5357 [Vulpes lagopus]